MPTAHEKLHQIKLERWAILFVGGKDTNGEPKSCFNCPHMFSKQETCEYMGPEIILRAVTKDGDLYTPVCGYQIGGLPKSTDDPHYLGGKDPEELGLEWAKGTGTNCYGHDGGAPCEHFEHTEGEDGTCEVMQDDDNKVDSDDCCAAHRGESIPWEEAQKLMPQFLEDKLRAGAAKKGYSGKRADAYVFGTMNNLGAMHGNKETAKGRAMDRKHAADLKLPSGRKRR